MAVLDFVIDKSSAFDSGMKFSGIFLDIPKLFDTICHNILLHKLSYCGFRRITCNSFQNYLCTRKPYVFYNSSKSTTENVSFGVSQISLFRPLLFILHTNDISNTASFLNTILFDDDTTVFYSHEDMHVLCQIINREKN